MRDQGRPVNDFEITRTDLESRQGLEGIRRTLERMFGMLYISDIRRDLHDLHGETTSLGMGA